MPSFKPVIALARGLEILRAINAEHEATVGSLHKATSLDKATIVRMLETLEHEGYVSRDPHRAVYMVTGRCLLLTQGYDNHVWVGKIAGPVMQEFRGQIGWPSDIAVFDHDAMIVAQTTREPGSLLFSRRPGFRFPLLATSMGLAYLAFCGEEEQSRIAARLAAAPGKWNGLARHPRQLAKTLAAVQAQGYALMSDEYSGEIFENRVWALGVPIKSEYRVFASMNVMLLRNAVCLEDGVRDYLAPLQRAATRIAALLAVQAGAGAACRADLV
jgi:IclR family transcriptional regulator, mhp operon transcriptional activator